MFCAIFIFQTRSSVKITYYIIFKAINYLYELNFFEIGFQSNVIVNLSRKYFFYFINYCFWNF